MKKENLTIALAFIGMMYFALGFAMGINTFLSPVLESALLSGKASQAYLMFAATFSAFIIFGYPASMLIKKIGYKRTMSLSFLIFAAGFAIFIPSIYYESFPLFLLASFVSGTANAILQAAVGPYVTICGPIESAAKRMSIMGIANKAAWSIAVVLFVWIIGKEINQVTLNDLYVPFYVIILIFIALGIFTLFAPIPDVSAAGEDDSEAGKIACPYAADKTSIWQFPHLLLGVLTLFIYVGVETVALGTVVGYAKELNLLGAAHYSWITTGGMAVGYILGIILIPKYISQGKALIICSSISIFGSLCVVLLPGIYSIWAIAFIALGCSLMWPAVWPLAIVDLGRFTKTGSSLLVMAIAGGGTFPIIYGALKDNIGAQNAYWICLPCFLFILYYAIWGYKIRINLKK